MRIIEPTMSKTDALLLCQWPYGKPLPPQDEVSEAARFGTAFHAVMAETLKSPRANFAIKYNYKELGKKYGVDGEAVKERVLTALPVLLRWLGGDNPYRINFSRPGQYDVEKSFALHMLNGTSRRCKPPDETTHVYPDRLPDELPGTADYIAFAEHTILILDHKTGYDVGQPGESEQLKSLALAVANNYKTAVVAFLHAPRENIATVYSDTLNAKDLHEHAKAIKAAWLKVGDGSLRPHEHCAYCPAFTVCPTQTSNLVALKRGAIGAPLTAERVGFIHETLAEFAALEGRLRDEIRLWVTKNGPGIRPDGKVVDLITKPWTNLSMASIKRALGEVEGAKMIAKLEKLKCVEHTERKELRAMPNESAR